MPGPTSARSPPTPVGRAGTGLAAAPGGPRRAQPGTLDSGPLSAVSWAGARSEGVTRAGRGQRLLAVVGTQVQAGVQPGPCSLGPRPTPHPGLGPLLPSAHRHLLLPTFLPVLYQLLKQFFLLGWGAPPSTTRVSTCGPSTAPGTQTAASEERPPRSPKKTRKRGSLCRNRDSLRAIYSSRKLDQTKFPTNETNSGNYGTSA